MSEDTIFLLLADGDGTLRSHDRPFGVAVRTEAEAEKFVEEGGVGYTHSYQEIRLFDKASDGVNWRFKK